MIDPRLLSAIEDCSYTSDSYYVLDLPLLNTEVDTFIQSFSPLNITPSYSYKTNYFRPLLQHLSNVHGFSSEIVSPFELDIAIASNIDPSSLIYNGPVKSRESIEYILNSGGLVNADSLSDLKTILSIPSRSNSKFRVGLRVCLAHDTRLPFSRFGISSSSSEFSSAIKLLDDSQDSFDLQCIHIHYPDRDINSFIAKVDSLLSLLFTSVDLNNYPRLSIDIGGGFPSNVPNYIKSQLLHHSISPIRDYGLILKELLDKYSLSSLNVILEPGTAIAANAFHLVSHVHSVNTRDDLSLLNIDASNTHFGGLRSSIYFPFTIVSPNTPSDTSRPLSGNFRLCGFTCVESDFLSPVFTRKILDTSSKFVFSSVGSYSAVFKSPFIRGDVALFVWDGQELSMHRRAQNAFDVSSTYLI